MLDMYISIGEGICIVKVWMWKQYQHPSIRVRNPRHANSAKVASETMYPSMKLQKGPFVSTRLSVRLFASKSVTRVFQTFSAIVQR